MKKNPFYGKKHSEETKAKIGKRTMGNTPPNVRAVIIDGEKYFSIAEASKKLEIPSATIFWRANRETERFANYQWADGVIKPGQIGTTEFLAKQSPQICENCRVEGKNYKTNRSLCKPCYKAFFLKICVDCGEDSDSKPFSTKERCRYCYNRYLTKIPNGGACSRCGGKTDRYRSKLKELCEECFVEMGLSRSRKTAV